MNSVRRYKRPVVQLTSLLDLLFVMIFVSLMQTKGAPPKAAETPKEAPKVETPAPAPKEAIQTGKIAVNATFNFFAPASNPGLPEGSYAMEGTFNQDTGFLQLGGVEWLNRPANYEMVPLKGTIDSAREVFTGNIEFPDCREFTLKRITKGSGSPIAGKWKGSYVCSQGETGLILTFQ
jgi:hypothetical protein